MQAPPLHTLLIDWQSWQRLPAVPQLAFDVPAWQLLVTGSQHPAQWAHAAPASRAAPLLLLVPPLPLPLPLLLPPPLPPLAPPDEDGHIGLHR
jgi:hypothetical protein